MTVRDSIIRTPSEDPWGGGPPPLHGGAPSKSLARHSAGIPKPSRSARKADKTDQEPVHAGGRLYWLMRGKAPLEMPAFQPYRGKPAVRNDREGRGNVGIIRSPVRASNLPDGGGREVKHASLPRQTARVHHVLLGGAAAWPLRRARSRRGYQLLGFFSTVMQFAAISRRLRAGSGRLVMRKGEIFEWSSAMAVVMLMFSE